mmetsp:Transcript_23783/g.61045  ORF Transcript_23783/g.61045 Transcript_23783/m.61045 type:complete len:233 (-) Transcript_23783:13-711(-)
MVTSMARKSTLPVSHMYLFRRSPWRFSSAVQARVQRAQPVCEAPVSSRTPSRVFSIVMYVGRASSVIMSPASTTRKSSGMFSWRLRSSTTSSRKVSEEGSGRKSCGCQHFSTGLRSLNSSFEAKSSRLLITSRRSLLMLCSTWPSRMMGPSLAGAWTACTRTGALDALAAGARRPRAALARCGLTPEETRVDMTLEAMAAGLCLVRTVWKAELGGGEEERRMTVRQRTDVEF